MRGLDKKCGSFCSLIMHIVTMNAQTLGGADSSFGCQFQWALNNAATFSMNIWSIDTKFFLVSID